MSHPLRAFSRRTCVLPLKDMVPGLGLEITLPAPWNRVRGVSWTIPRKTVRQNVESEPTPSRRKRRMRAVGEGIYTSVVLFEPYEQMNLGWLLVISESHTNRALNLG